MEEERDPINAAYREHHEEMKEMRDKRRGQWAAMRGQLEREGYTVTEITPYQFRITKPGRKTKLDFYPSNKRAGAIPDNKWYDVRGVNPYNWITNFFRTHA